MFSVMYSRMEMCIRDRPYVVQSISTKDGTVVQNTETEVVRQVVSQETSQRATDILEQVVSKGTGRNAYVARCV